MPSFSKNKNCQSCCNKRVNSACSVPRLSCSRLCPGTSYKGQRSPRGGAGLPVCTWPTAAVTQTKPRGRRLSCLHVYTLSLCTHTYSGECDRLITAPSPRPLHSDTCGVIHTCLLWVVWERGTSVVFIWVLGSLSLTLSYDRRSAWQHCNMRDTLYLPSQGLYDSV